VLCEELLTLPFCSFGEFSGTRGHSCVTVLLFWTIFGHARGFLRYRFALLGVFGHTRTLLRYRFALLKSFRARERLLATTFPPFNQLSRTQDPLAYTFSPF
jgi:hypothetical protein